MHQWENTKFLNLNSPSSCCFSPACFSGWPLGFQMGPLWIIELCKWELTGPACAGTPNPSALTQSPGDFSFPATTTRWSLGPTLFLVDLRVSLDSHREWGGPSAWSQEGTSYNFRVQPGFSPTMWSPEQTLARVEDVNFPDPGGKGSSCSQAAADHVVSVDPNPSPFFSQCPLWTCRSCMKGSGLSPEFTVLFVLINVLYLSSHKEPRRSSF